MWPYFGPTTTAQIMGNTLAPIRCNWNASCQGFTGVANNLPVGGIAGDFEPGMNVTCGQNFIICLSNYNSLNTVIPISFFGTAGISCSTITGLSVNSPVICEGQSASIVATGGTNYSWSNGVTSASQVVTPNTTTTYTVTAQSDCGLTSQTAVVTVKPLPIVDAGNAQTVCAGTSISLIGSGANTYSWSNGIFNATPFTAQQSQLYTLTGTATNGCSNTDTVHVIVNPLPSVNAGSDQLVCDGTQVILNGIGAPTLSWNNGISNMSPFSQPVGTTIYTLTGTSNQGCVKSDQVSVTVSPLPQINAGSDIFVCEGNAITLTATGAVTYTWSNSVVNSVPFIPNSTNVYSVTGTSSSGCTNTDELSVVVNPLPLIEAGSSIEICEGQQVTLSGTGSPNITWNYGIIDNVPFTPSNTQTYTATALSPEGCINSDNVQVTVHPNPTPSISGVSNYCSLSSCSLTTNNIYESYSWSNGSSSNTVNATQNDNPIWVSVTNSFGCSAVSPSVYVSENNLINTFQTLTICEGDSALIHGNYEKLANVYSTTIFTPAGCDSVSTITLNVNPKPTLNAGTDLSICLGQSIQFNASSNGTITWSNSISNGQTISPQTGMNSYIVSAVSLQGCQNSDTLNVLVHDLPIINAGADYEICLGNSTTLNALGSLLYTWTNGVINNVPFTPTSTATYSLTGTDSNGCVNSDQISVIVHPLPNVFAGNNIEVCEGTSVVLNASGAATYSWNNGTINGTSITPAVGVTTYTVVGISQYGCSNSSDVQITVNPLPQVSAGSNVEVCENTPIILQGAGAANFSWTGGVQNNQPFIPMVGNTTYTVTGTSSFGCSSSSNVDVLVHPNPTISAGNDVSICEGSSVTLNASGGINYVWNNGIQNGVSFIPLISQVYTVTGNSIYGCSNSDLVFVTVNPIPTVFAGIDTVICFGEPITLSALGANSYTWNNGIANNTSFIPEVGDFDYAVIGTTSAGCSNSDTIHITIKALPNLNFESTANSGCIPKTIQFLNTTENTFACSWKFGDDLNAVNYSDAAYTFTKEGCFDIQLTIEGTNGCSTSKVFTNFICVEDAPIVNFTPSSLSINSFDTTILFLNETIGATDYTWDFGDQTSLSNEVNPTHDYLSTLPYGNYSVQLIAYSSMGCVDSNFTTLHMEEEALFFIPNSFTPDGSNLNETFQPIFTDGFDPYSFELTIYDRWGELIFESHDATIGWDGIVLNTGEFAPNGIYTWNIIYGKTNNAERTSMSGHVNLIR
jgi:gliding motility-associated-like protein